MKKAQLQPCLLLQPNRHWHGFINTQYGYWCFRAMIGDMDSNLHQQSDKRSMILAGRERTRAKEFDSLIVHFWPDFLMRSLFIFHVRNLKMFVFDAPKWHHHKRHPWGRTLGLFSTNWYQKDLKDAVIKFKFYTHKVVFRFCWAIHTWYLNLWELWTTLAKMWFCVRLD